MSVPTFSSFVIMLFLLGKAMENDLKVEEFVDWLSSSLSLLYVSQKFALSLLMFLFTASEYDELLALSSIENQSLD